MVLVTDSIALKIYRIVFLLPITKEVRVQVNEPLALMFCITINFIKK